ncbi:hypothetical protein [Polyangium mundeleinium]|uniref:EGF-like domain-containing protein n=1 Tax=Polyangium mundeleinium TaxID=2995306 RepID=A0ABT5EGX5_9BACT|nr:hypothetical protein [Polyangium mundeleinium]MDC0741079.1 hypothetical protein [Polyangium mundeleinium]
MAFLTKIPLRALMAMTAGLLLFVACGDEGGSLAGATKRCGQDVGCQPGETCKLNFIEWGWECSCVGGKLACEPWSSGSGAPPEEPPAEPGIRCNDSYCQDNYLASSCRYTGVDCNYEVKCSLGTGETISIDGDCR